jgi:lycopene beta-cyclase
MNHGEYDVIVAGGGLAGTLCAYRLQQKRPELRILLLEETGRLGGIHTWSFHDTDISRDARAWVTPFVVHRWKQQQVRFPRYTRMLVSGYNTILSGHLHDTALALLKDSVRFSARVEKVEPHAVQLADGETFRAACVIDARGIGPVKGLTIGYQKFLGLEVRTAQPHGQAFPVIMDAAVEQRDGYRFVYTLPYAEDRILIEDTYYSDTPAIDMETLRARCASYAKQRGWFVTGVLHVEKGVLPIVLSGDPDTLLQQKPEGVPAIGLRGGFFHHTTSYSLPFAVRCADAIAAAEPLTSEVLDLQMQQWAREHWQTQSFFRLLNRMLFWAAKPAQRFRVLERFYELRTPLIDRFYSSSLTRADKARILVGWPPVPIGKALRVMGESKDNPISGTAAG